MTQIIKQIHAQPVMEKQLRQNPSWTNDTEQRQSPGQEHAKAPVWVLHP